METPTDAITRQIEAFTEVHRRSLEVLATAIQRATGDDEVMCSARAWLLFRWARSQRDPRAAAAGAVRRMNEARLQETRPASNSGVHPTADVGDHPPATRVVSH